jgi:TrmH family RNA methyltransferase
MNAPARSSVLRWSIKPAPRQRVVPKALPSFAAASFYNVSLPHAPKHAPPALAGPLPIDVVLVSPRNPLNIGAVARAMANFGFEHLTVVAPYEPHWREAQSAVGAEDLLQNARVCDTLAEAVASATLVFGTGTLEPRRPEQPVVSLPDLVPLLKNKSAHGARVALVFGPEKHGLTRDDLSFCHYLLTIPTDARQPSMNLGQAVAVCLYELASRLPICGSAYGSGAESSPPLAAPSPSEQPDEAALAATSSSLDRLAGVVEETMLAAGYSPRSMQAANRHDLRLMLRRVAPNAKDTRRILGLFRRILWRLNRPVE